MRIRDILPSTQFMVIAGSILLSGGLVYAADLLTNHPQPGGSVAVDTSTAQNQNWKQALEEIQSQSPLNRLPQAPSEASVNTLLTAATSDNVTDTVARTLFINLSNAKAQGLGSDIPTQDALIADAAAKINKDSGAAAYVSADLTLAADTPEAIEAYGNAFITAMKRHPKVSYEATMYTIATSTDNNDPKRLAPLSSIGADYSALANDLAHIAVPPTMTPLHLQVVNNFARIAKTFPDMKVLYSDPLRALAGLQLFEALNQETLRLFINIAQNFSQKGILFNKDEPGSAWSTLAP